MNDFTIGLALYDYLPSVFTGLALVFIAQMVRRSDPDLGWMAFTGAALVVLAGVFKASWKLVMATGGPDIWLFREALFPLMGPGFLLVGVAAWAAVRAARGKTWPRGLWLVPVAVIALAYAAGAYLTLGQGTERGWFPVFLMLASVANLGLSLLLIAESVRRRRWLVVGLFALNVGMIFALQPIAAMEDKSIALHWFEQTLTTGGAAAFALGGYLLLNSVTDSLLAPSAPAPAVGD
jgi:hypothetical protein